jgi:hypothetical protein
MKRALILATGVIACMVSPSAAPASEPTFFARRDYSTEWGQIIVTDANADKLPDVISFDGGYAAVMFGNGDGTLRQGPSSNHRVKVDSAHWREEARASVAREIGAWSLAAELTAGPLLPTEPVANGAASMNC